MKAVWLSKKRIAVFFSKKYFYTIVITLIFLLRLPETSGINVVRI